jgi:predicted amidohydrolase
VTRPTGWRPTGKGHPMQLAAATYPIEWHNRWNDYVGKLRVWVRTGAGRGAALLVFPEFAALELASLADEDNAADPVRATAAVSARLKDATDLHASLAREFGIHICAGSAPLRANGDAPLNQVRLFAPSGDSAAQAALRPDADARERWGIVAGPSPRVFDTALGRIGILIGADIAERDIATAMVASGAQVLLAQHWAESRAAHEAILAEALARAGETGAFIGLACAVGATEWTARAPKAFGRAAILGPGADGTGEVLARGVEGEVGWVQADVPIRPRAPASGNGAEIVALHRKAAAGKS